MSSASSSSSSSSNNHVVDDDIATIIDSNQTSPLSSSSSSSSSLALLPWCSQPLREPLPLDKHACSVSLPTWASVVGYEEGSVSVSQALKCGYPRFVYHPFVLQLMEYVVGNYNGDNGNNMKQQKRQVDCLVLPSKHAALRCRAFLQQALYHEEEPAVDICQIHTVVGQNSNHHSNDDDKRIQVLDLQSAKTGIHAVLFPAQTLAGMEAKAYWQHTGEVVSSRRAEVCLHELGILVMNDTGNTDAETTSATVTMASVNPNDDVDDKLPPVSKYSAYHCSSSGSSSNGERSTNDNGDHGNTSSTAASAIGADTDSTGTAAASPPTNDFQSFVASSSSSSSSPHELVKDRIGQLTGVPSDHVYLTASGMSSIYAALLSSRRTCGQDKASVVFGFPYLDTLKLCGRTEFCKGGVEFFGHGHDEDLDALQAFLETPGNKEVCALFTEIPSNPLLQCPNLERLRTLTEEHGVALVVDDTIGNFYNVDLLQTGLADVVCTSLTKFFSGRGDAMAGSLIANPYTTIGARIQADMAARQSLSSSPSTLFEADAWAIWHNSHDFHERMARINETTSQLADYLMEHPDVEQIYYPKYHSSPYYANCVSLSSRGGAGQTQGQCYYGGLFSILLDSHICQRTFYDALDVAKGPSLGTNFTLACPYTLLAHYHELDFAMSYNVQPNLLRISVGLEDLNELRDKFATALAASRLHPKISPKFRGSSSLGGGGGEPPGAASRSFCTVPDGTAARAATAGAATRVTPNLRGLVASRSTNGSSVARRSSIRAALKFAMRGRGVAL